MTIHHDQIEFMLGIQGCFNMCKSIRHHINRIKDKQHMIISLDADKYLTKYNILSWLKTFNKLGIEGHISS